jgi:hypothetical protein
VHTHSIDPVGGGHNQAPQTVFEEPESSSLLDNFGF